MSIVHDLAAECVEDLAEQYERSEEFTVDAIEWVADAGELPADLVLMIQDCYRSSRAFDAKVGDAADGERAWS